MKKCKNKKCRNELSDSAIKCLKCGRDQRFFLKRHPIFYTLLIIIVVLAIFAGRDSRQEDITEAELSEKTTTTSTIKNEYNIGETFENGFLDVKYISFNDNFQKHSQYANVESQHDVVEVEFEFQNLSSKEKLITSNEFKCYADGNECERFYSVKNATFSIKLLAKKKIKENVYFQVPVKAEEIKIQYETPYAENGYIEFIVR